MYSILSCNESKLSIQDITCLNSSKYISSEIPNKISLRVYLPNLICYCASATHHTKRSQNHFFNRNYPLQSIPFLFNSRVAFQYSEWPDFHLSIVWSPLTFVSSAIAVQSALVRAIAMARILTAVQSAEFCQNFVRSVVKYHFHI